MPFWHHTFFVALRVIYKITDMTVESCDRVEYALSILNHPELRRKAEVQEWLAHQENVALYEELRVLLEAGMRVDQANCPDVEAEWCLFRRNRMQGLRHRITRLIAAAATMVLLLGGGVMWWQNIRKNPELLQHMVADVDPGRPGRMQAVLITDTGKEFVLGTRTSSNVIPEEGIKVGYDSTAGIRYQLTGSVKTGYHKLRIPKAGEYKLELSDGTVVWLNSDSELRYPVQFGGDVRQVELKGEAYFSVTKDVERPFVVVAAGIHTRVYGTGFNIRSYDPGEVNVTLVEGAVSVGDEDERTEFMLQPGENARFTSGHPDIEKVNVQKYVAWKDGYFYYERERLDHIMDDLKRWYDFDVVYVGERVRDLSFELWSTRDCDLATVMAYLTRTNKIEVKVEGRNVVVSRKPR